MILSVADAPAPRQVAVSTGAERQLLVSRLPGKLRSSTHKDGKRVYQALGLIFSRSSLQDTCRAVMESKP